MDWGVIRIMSRFTPAFTPVSPDNRMTYSVCSSPTLLSHLNLRSKEHRVSMSSPWSPKEIKLRQLPGKSNKVYHSVCHDVVFGRRQTNETEKKQRLRNNGWVKDRHQILNPECDKKRGIIVLSKIMIILLVQDRQQNAETGLKKSYVYPQPSGRNLSSK